jgi:hypothetical protein
MIKLYKEIEGVIHYWECWENDNKSSIAHWGVLGERGSDEVIDNERAEQEINNHMEQGYVEFNELETSMLFIEYTITGMGTIKDLEKRHRLEERMNDAMGWTGLGHCDGGSIGADSMEVCCMVVDYEIAKKVIETDLKDSEFADYSSIYLAEMEEE